MSEPVISARGVEKVFRRYTSPIWQALDALGFPVSRRRYEPFAALKGLDLEVRRGERLALIGRNGAGKSTLLRILSGQMRPSAGEVQVRGNAHALMELGTGFHPDFTGLENVRSALAFNGIPEREIAARIDDIIDFAELDEFMQRPVSEYSAGMYTRLAFAVQTSITPDILVIDEILGAGDAYFVGKSIQRMKELTSAGATVLFVSHDMSAVQLLCDRAVWLQHGTVRMDGDTLAVSKAYMAQVRVEEEARLAARTRSMTKGQAEQASQLGATSLLLRFAGEGGPPRQPLWLGATRLLADGARIATLTGDLAEDRSEGGQIKLWVDPIHMNWGPPKARLGRQARPFGDFGGRFAHAPISVALDPSAAPAWRLELDVLPSPVAAVTLDIYDEAEGEYRTLARIPASADQQWQTLEIELPLDDTSQPPEPAPAELLQILDTTERYGSGEARITAFGFLDAEGARRHTLVSGEPARARLVVAADTAVWDPVAVIAVYRPDGTCALQVTSNRDGMSLSKLEGRAMIEAEFDPLYLGPGDYIVAVALFKELDLRSAVEPAAYDLHDRCYALKVLHPMGVGVEIGTVNQPSRWTIAHEAPGTAYAGIRS
jgi:lipopolysaccharide transport system ATP-binding protein